MEKHATHYQTGQPMKGFVKGKVYKVLRVKAVNQSQSKHAYLLEGINSWVLEQDLAPSTVGHSEQTYTVQKGDTLSTIAKRFKTTYQELARINSIPDPNRIKVGQVLKLV